MLSKKSDAVVETAPDETTVPGTDPVVWDPFERFGFPDLFNRWTWATSPMPERMMAPLSEMRDIRVEHFLEDGDLVVRGEIPGVDPDSDVDISVDDDRLTIRATREHRSEDTENGFRSEFRYGSFSRVLTLPKGADTDAVTASYTDGILEVRVPIDDEKAGRRKVDVLRV